MIEYFDISPMVTEKLAVFPGDQPFARKVSMSFSQGDHLELSQITTTLHLGSHADAPSHYDHQGESIGTRSLEPYLGPCEVKKVEGLTSGERIQLTHLSSWVPRAPRVLFRTDSFVDPYVWRDDFNSLSPKLVEWLAAHNVMTVGIDTPSVDPAHSKVLESHKAIAKAKMAILEGVILTEVPDGLYQLIALPLRLQGCDASPVRAILIPQGQSVL